MIVYYFKSAWRNLTANKLFSIISISGLAIGIASCIVVCLFIKDEYSYDRQYKDADRIYRVVTNVVNDDGSKTASPTLPPALAIAMQKQLPEVENVVRLFPPASAWGSRFYVRYGDKKFVEENLYRADSSIFNVFSFSFVQGDPQTAFKDVNSIVLTASAAKKYFGNNNPLGRILEIDDWSPQRVTAVIKDLPDNVHFKMDMLISLKSLDGNNRLSSMWGWNSFYTYFKVRPGTSMNLFDKKLKTIFRNNASKSKDDVYSQSLVSIHLYSDFTDELRPNSHAMYSYIFGIISFFILISACINYINLSTARAAIRAKEIGVRKITGAGKSSLVAQFLMESVLSSFIAAVFSLFLAGLFLPVINNITGKHITILGQDTYYITIPGTFLLALIIGMLAGIYPALYLSSVQPAKVLKKNNVNSGQSLNLRKVLMVTQFSISIVLIIGIIIVRQQVRYIQNAKLGLNKEQVIIVNDIGFLNSNEKIILKDELIKLKGVKIISAADGVPGGYNWNRNLRYKAAQNNQAVNFLSVDDSFIPAFSMEIKEGRNFSSLYPADTANAVLLNETAVKKLGIPEPVVGQQVVWNQNEKTGAIIYATVCGIVKDFHFSSMKNEIKPFALVKRNNRQWVYAIKLAGENMNETLTSIKNTWNKNINSRPFQYSFLSETYAKLYAADMNFKIIFSYISFIAILIACLGLFGLSLFVTKQRTKEIGIRKVLGASVVNILSLLSKDFVQLILIASLISFPLAWWLSAAWLRGYAYQADISWRVFVSGDLLVLCAALVTISFHTAKAAMDNPVESLRSE
ncbi:MAG: ABC transporter permease [Bacteroidota bacterium]